MSGLYKVHKRGKARYLGMLRFNAHSVTCGVSMVSVYIGSVEDTEYKVEISPADAQKLLPLLKKLVGEND